MPKKSAKEILKRTTSRIPTCNPHFETKVEKRVPTRVLVSTFTRWGWEPRPKKGFQKGYLRLQGLH